MPHVPRVQLGGCVFNCRGVNSTDTQHGLGVVVIDGCAGGDRSGRRRGVGGDLPLGGGVRGVRQIQSRREGYEEREHFAERGGV
eukprot:scaffold30657_cov56-Phaeocystis_antarctica.AAC.2